MANKKITELNEATSVSGNDWLVIVDVANDETKKVHANQVGGNIPIQDTAPQDPEEDDLWIDTSEEGFDNSNVVNQYSTSASDVYSCSYVNNISNYSTSETIVGKWIDGKTLYRKVIDTGALPNATTKSVAHNISNVSRFVKLYGYAYTSNGQTYPLPWVHTTGTNYQTYIYCDSANVYLVSGSDRSNVTESYIVLEYTKTS